MRMYARVVAAVGGVLAAGLLLAPGVAVAAPTVKVDEVVAAVGLTSEPADYVLLVDTSGSMNQDGRYATVRRELRKLVAGLEADDRVSLVTFDSKAVPRFRGVVGKNPDTVLAKLPARATGQRTDIGAAISAGLTELERADTHRLTALILITDGEVDATEGSKYADVRSSAWKKLRQRADELGKQHEVAGYAVSLQSVTDAGLLKKVLPESAEVSASQVGKRFAEVGQDLVRLQAAAALEAELAEPIRVAWHGDLGAAVANNTPTPLQLEFSSPYAHVPVELSDFRVQAPSGLDVELAGLPEKVLLAGGETATVDAQVLVSGVAGSEATMALTAKVTSPWRKALEEGLGMKFAPAVESSVAVPAAPLKLPPALLSTAGWSVVGLAALAAAAWLGRILTTPRMDGLLSLRRDGRELADIVLSGRTAKLLAPEAAKDLAGLSGSVTGARGRSRGQRAVRVDARFGAERVRGVVAEGDVLQMGDVEITYISEHRRILDMIAVPRA